LAVCIMSPVLGLSPLIETGCGRYR
jgi:hypothetical protein